MNGRVKRRPPGYRRLHLEAKLREIECIDKGVDGPDGIVLANPIVEALRKESPLASVSLLNEASHQAPAADREGILADSPFSRSQDPLYLSCAVLRRHAASRAQ